MSSRLRIHRARLVAGALLVTVTTAPVAAAVAAPRGIDPAVPVIDVAGGFRATISWGDTEDGEPVTLHLEIGEAGVFPPESHQIADDIVLCENGQPTARVNSYVYLRDRFQLPVVDVFVDWQEYCSGDPYDGDSVEYTIVITQLPEFVTGGPASEPLRITGTYRPAYRGDYSMGLEDHVARVRVAAARGGGSGGGSGVGTTIGIVALVAVGAGGVVTIIRRVRRSPGTEIDGIRRQIDVLRRRRNQLFADLDAVRAEIDRLTTERNDATRHLLAANTQLGAAQNHAWWTDQFWNGFGLVPFTVAGVALAHYAPGRDPGWQKFWANAGTVVLGVGASLVSWTSAAVPPEVTAAFEEAQRRLADTQMRWSRAVGREQELSNQIVAVDAEITGLEARRAALMTTYPGTGSPPAP